MTYYLGISGARTGGTDRQLIKLEQLLTAVKIKKPQTICRHGNCVGVDEQADAICVKLSIPTEAFPSTWTSTQSKTSKAKIMSAPERPYKRNTTIVNSIHGLIALPRGSEESGLSPGTWDAINKARQRRIIVAVILPDGSLIK